MKYLYLHGLGQKPDSWDRVIKETKVSDSSVSLSLAEMLEGKAATYGELYTAFSEECDKENDEIVLCGLSLGAVLALNYAIDHPDKVKALVLIAAQYKCLKNYWNSRICCSALCQMQRSSNMASKSRCDQLVRHDGRIGFQEFIV